MNYEDDQTPDEFSQLETKFNQQLEFVRNGLKSVLEISKENGFRFDQEFIDCLQEAHNQIVVQQNWASLVSCW